MSAAINMIDFVSSVRDRPRGRACVVLTRDYKDQREWATKLAEQTSSGYLDLSKIFAEDPQMSGNIGQFMVPALFEYLQKHTADEVLVVLGLEFITATWSAQPDAIDEFLSQVKTWDKKPALIFVIQHNTTMTTYDFGRRFQYTYVIDQKETLAL
jgi:hypothetical protein